MEQKIQKGTISSLVGDKDANGDYTQARVLPGTADGAVSAILTIPWYLRGKMGNLEPGTEVAYVVFEDYTGLVLARMDGDWGKTVPGSVSVTGDVTADGKSLSKHTHPTSDGQTGPPN